MDEINKGNKDNSPIANTYHMDMDEDDIYGWKVLYLVYSVILYRDTYFNTE